MGVLKNVHASLIPSTTSLNCHITSGCSGLPKFKQFVAANGRPPEQTILRHDSATASFAPSRGFRATRYAGPSSVIARAFFVPLILTTAASEPGPSIVFDWTMWSYCSHTHCRQARFGEDTASFRRWL